MKRSKNDFVNALTEVGLQITDANKVVNSFISVIQKSLKNGNDVLLNNFGKFVVRKMKGYTFKNPKTMVSTEIKEHYKIKFIPSKNLKKAINDSTEKKV